MGEKQSSIDFSKWEMKSKKILTGEADDEFYEEFTLISPNPHFYECIKIRTLPEITLFTGDWGTLALEGNLQPKHIHLNTQYAFSKIEFDLKGAWKEFDGEATAEELKRHINELEDNYSFQSDIDKYKEILEDLIGCTDDPVEYMYNAYRGELDWDYEEIPNVYKYKIGFEIYVNAFNEIHKRLNIC